MAVKDLQSIVCKIINNPIINGDNSINHSKNNKMKLFMILYTEIFQKKIENL